MATPGDLVRTMAELLGIPVATVVQYDRQLAEAGLRSKRGRGTSAAAITAADAATLLIAIAAAPLSGPTLKDAVRSCQAYGSLPIRWEASRPKRFRNFGLPTLASLRREHCLHDALSVLIDGAARGEFFKIPVRGQRPITKADAFCGARFEGPHPWAEIVADATLGDSQKWDVARLVYATPNDPRRKLGREQREHSGDLFQIRGVSFRTIRGLGDLLHPPLSN
jgi:hypothetical protein